MLCSMMTNSEAFSPQVNYTNWTTVTCRRLLMSPFADGVGGSRGQCCGRRTAVNLSYPDRSRHFFFQEASDTSSWGWVDPIPEPLLLRKSGSTGIEPETYGSAAKNSEFVCAVCTMEPPGNWMGNMPFAFSNWDVPTAVDEYWRWFPRWMLQCACILCCPSAALRKKDVSQCAITRGTCCE
jgi:hypothetical protein